MRIVDLIFYPPDTTFIRLLFIKLGQNRRRAVRTAEEAMDALDAKGWSHRGPKHRAAI